MVFAAQANLHCKNLAKTVSAVDFEADFAAITAQSDIHSSGLINPTMHI